MKGSMSLDGNWIARGHDGQHGDPEHYRGVTNLNQGFIRASVPGDIHTDLIQAGWLQDPDAGMNVLAARWVEEQVWVYRRTFEPPSEALSRRAWVVFHGLDLNAVIYLNDEEVGRHNNAFTPCRIDVTGKLISGENRLAVVLESGLYGCSEKRAVEYSTRLDDRLHKRMWQRKPQYQFSWDWNPRLINVGIWRSVRLEWCDAARIDSVAIYSELVPDHSFARVIVKPVLDNVTDRSASGILRLGIQEAGIEIERQVDLDPGLSSHAIDAELESPALWWPVGHGAQNLYTVRLELVVDGRVIDSAACRTGIRSVCIDQSPHPDCGEHFILRVNGRPIFAKGANWVPPDTIYARITPEKYRRLVRMAVDANFNTLRIWGGGLYADHSLLDACDELGVLVWHDFIFACAKYPADDPDFVRNIRDEVRFIVRDLSAHPSVVVWCGNNEIDWGAWHLSGEFPTAYLDHAIYHVEIPRILFEEDPSRPYWPSSPFSTDQRYPNDPVTGDQHPWDVTIGAAGTDFWAYRGDVSRFPNEGGVLGATGIDTLKKFLPDEQRYVHSPAWELHDNAINFLKPTGVTYRMLDDWLGLDYRGLDLESYAFLSGLLQAEGLQEYINNFRRRMFSSASAIFWMYNDSWPVTHGWAIVDYYLRRKIAYHPVRRAFAPVTAIPAVEGDEVIVYGVNDTPEDLKFAVRFGIFSLHGGIPLDEQKDVVLPANSSTVIGRIGRSDWESLGTSKTGAFALLSENGRVISQNRLFVKRFKDLRFACGQVELSRCQGVVIARADTFVWGACLDPGGGMDLADDVFDLLPGVEYIIPWPDGLPEPTICVSGSGLMADLAKD